MPVDVTVKDGLVIRLRDAVPDDEAVIMRAWLVGHWKNGDWPRRMPKERYFREHKATVQTLVARSRTIVACNPDRESQVFGFLCHSGPVLHWVYVKQMYRRMGVARALLTNERAHLSVCSHWTMAAETHLREAFGLRYDPFHLEAR